MKELGLSSAGCVVCGSDAVVEVTNCLNCGTDIVTEELIQLKRENERLKEVSRAVALEKENDQLRAELDRCQAGLTTKKQEKNTVSMTYEGKISDLEDYIKCLEDRVDELKDENDRLRAERDRLKAELEKWDEMTLADL